MLNLKMLVMQETQKENLLKRESSFVALTNEELKEMIHNFSENSPDDFFQIIAFESACEKR